MGSTLVAVDADGKIFGHLAGLNRVDASALDCLRELDELRVVVQLAAVLEAPSPRVDRRDRVRRGRAALYKQAKTHCKLDLSLDNQLTINYQSIDKNK